MLINLNVSFVLLAGNIPIKNTTPPSVPYICSIAIYTYVLKPKCGLYPLCAKSEYQVIFPLK